MITLGIPKIKIKPLGTEVKLNFMYRYTRINKSVYLKTVQKISYIKVDLSNFSMLI